MQSISSTFQVVAGCLLALLLSFEEGTVTKAENIGAVNMEGFGKTSEEVGLSVAQVVEAYAGGCYLIAVGVSRQTSILPSVVRSANKAGVILLDLSESDMSEAESNSHLMQGLWDHYGSPCSAVIFDVTMESADISMRFLTASAISLRPDTRVILVGERSGVEAVLRHPSLRNSAQVLYLALESLTHKDLYSEQPLNMRRNSFAWSSTILVYSKCLYCDHGDSGIVLLHQWHLPSLLPEGAKHWGRVEMDLKGHRVEVVQLRYFPYMDYQRDSESPGTTVTPQDSLDVRILDNVAQHLNFTYLIREPLDGQWGRRMDSGNWNGIVGTLQQQQADLCLDLTLTGSRMQVIEFSRVYIAEPIVITSLKPQPLPQYLSLIKSFTADVWKMVAVSIFVAGITLWMLQKAWAATVGDRGLGFVSAFLYSWGVLLEDPPITPPNNSSCRLVVFGWLIYCLVIATAYRSSLAANLTVQERSSPIDTFEDLLKYSGWKWGLKIQAAAQKDYFASSSDPVIRRIAAEMELGPMDELMERVANGKYSFFGSKYNILDFIASFYTDTRGQTNFYVGANEYHLSLGLAWGFRKGSPLRCQISRVKQRLIEGGLINYWMKDVLWTRSRKTRLEKKKHEQVTGNTEKVSKDPNRG